MSTKVLFLGTDAVVPAGGEDTASFVFNQKCLIDTGWYAPLRMRHFGVDPLVIDSLFFTHFHHDHYLGLPHLLFTLAMRGQGRTTPLTIAGPAEDLERVVERAWHFLQPDRFPDLRVDLRLLPLRPGEEFEDEALRVTTCASAHPVAGLVYRFHDKTTDAAIAFCGDTAYRAEIVDHVRGVDLLVYEASYAASPAPASNASLHSGAPDAARVAFEAKAKRLALVHCGKSKREDAVLAAQMIFPDSFWPENGQVVNLP